MNATPRPPHSFGTATFALLLGVASLTGCQESDIDSIDELSRFAPGFVSDDSAEGEVIIRIWDMLDGSSKQTTHLRFPTGGDVELILDEGVVLERGTYLRAFGEYNDEGALEVDHYDVLGLPPEPLTDPEWYDPRRIATILVFWDSPGLPNNEAKSSMFLGNRSTHVFYGENSYGKESVIGEVFGPYEIEDPGGCNVGFIAAQAQQRMIDKGHDPNDYRQFMYHFPFISGCGFAGLANVGSVLNPAQDSWYNGSFGCVVRNQEIGHNYGMGHSHAYNCSDGEGNDVPFWEEENCEHIEYGDPYDPMGGGCGHINVVQKTYMGWLEDCNVLTAPVDGTYNISPTELPCDGTQALRFPAFDGRYYWLEYRAAIGEFVTGQGVYVHVAGEVGGGGPSPYIIDVGSNGVMDEGDSYTDPEGAVTFEILEINDTHAVVDVTYPDGGSGQVECRNGDSPGMDFGNVGAVECLAEPTKGDTVPPEVTLTYPNDGDVFETGANFTITAEATDDRIVAEMLLYVDGEPQFKILNEPWEYDIVNIPEGEYEFGIVARDGVNWTPSNAVTITVTDDPPQGDDDDDEGDDDDDDEGETGDEPVDPTDGDDDDDDDDDEDDDEGDPDAVEGDEGCACSASDPNRGLPGALALGVMLVALRRRRD